MPLRAAAASPWLILLLIVVLASILRLARLDDVPPGLHVDEAVNAWNAYTLLKTGKDKDGVPWPLFYTRGFGEHRSTVYVYAQLPFQALGGINVWTARLPAALGGVMTVLLVYVIGARWFDVPTGLIAAAMLAVNPWHVQVSRVGVEAALVPLFVTATVAAFLCANLPVEDDETRRPRAVAAFAAGAVAGICCYGYYAVRLFLPAFVVGAVLVTWRGWWRAVRSREGAVAIAALVLAGSLLAGPLLWKHLTSPEMASRGRTVGWVWSESDTVGEKVAKALARYPGHFGSEFLFQSGDRNPALSPPRGVGLFHWYDLPLMLLGGAVLLRRAPGSRAARILLLWIALYPIADLLTQHASMHSLRSLPGVPGLTLAAAVGAGTGWKWLAGRSRRAAVYVAVAAVVLALVVNIRFVWLYFTEFRADKSPQIVYAVDVLEAARWLRPRLDEVDAVFITGTASHPAIISLVGLRYDPARWFRDEREMIRGPLPNGWYRDEDVCRRYGKIHVMLDDESLGEIERLLQNARRDRVVFIVRPGELGLERYAAPVFQVRDPTGAPVLWVFDLSM